MVGLIYKGFGFYLNIHSGQVIVVSPSSLEEKRYVAPAELINRYDLRIWAHAFVSAQ